ncbi:VTC domain-containing protein [Streptococcus suis]|nr:VTC domain-containing protein [Streptococcus suis]
MNEVLRKEKKYLLPLEMYYYLSGKLEKILKVDSYGKEDGYCVRSLYFDSLEDVDWQEQEDGLENRRKIRLRNYGNGSQNAKLELKQKQGDNQRKRSLLMTKSDGDLVHIREDTKELSSGTTIIAIWNASRQNYFVR